MPRRTINAPAVVGVVVVALLVVVTLRLFVQYSREQTEMEREREQERSAATTAQMERLLERGAKSIAERNARANDPGIAAQGRLALCIEGKYDPTRLEESTRQVLAESYDIDDQELADIGRLIQRCDRTYERLETLRSSGAPTDREGRSVSELELEWRNRKLALSCAVDALRAGRADLAREAFDIDFDDAGSDAATKSLYGRVLTAEAEAARYR